MYIDDVRYRNAEYLSKFEQITESLGYDGNIGMFIVDRKYYYVGGWLCNDMYGKEKMWFPFGQEKEELEEQIRKWKEKKQMKIMGEKDEKQCID